MVASIVGVLLLVLIGAIVLTPRTSSEPLDPASARGNGTRAVAQVLGQHGVRVRIVRRAAELEDVGVRGATVVLTRPQLLSAASLTRTMAAAEHARRHAVLQAVEPPRLSRRVHLRKRGFRGQGHPQRDDHAQAAAGLRPG